MRKLSLDIERYFPRAHPPQAYEPEPQPDIAELEGWTISRCGLVCDTCPAFKIGVCGGCPSLSKGMCVIRDCVDRQGIKSCADCMRPSCYHFEAFAARREAMKLLTKEVLRRDRLVFAKSNPGGGGGCGGGCSSGGGGG